ncbi:MAG: DUF3887 domain-containing protein [Clostridiales bacterium]|jgi:hypothetical protein|nr:DUF3887 domain-containing protein [Clostridiales bacterium]
MKGLRIKKLGPFLLVILICLALLNGCGGRKLSEDFDEDEVKKQAEKVITLINNRDSENLIEMCNVQMKEVLTDEVLGKVYEAVGEGGQYEGIEDMSVAGWTDKKSEEEFAVVVARAKYEIRTFTFTITFTKQMKLAGLYYR